MSGPHIEPGAEGLFNPELLKRYLAAAFHLLLPFASLFILLLESRARAAMLKLNLAAHAPATPEVVTQINDGMGNVDAAMRRVVLILRRILIAVDVVTIEMACVHSLAIAS